MVILNTRLFATCVLRLSPNLKRRGKGGLNWTCANISLCVSSTQISMRMILSRTEGYLKKKRMNRRGRVPNNPRAISTQREHNESGATACGIMKAVLLK